MKPSDKPPSRQAVINAQGYEHVTAIRKAATRIEDQLAGDRNGVIIGAACEEIATANTKLFAMRYGPDHVD